MRLAGSAEDKKPVGDAMIAECLRDILQEGRAVGHSAKQAMLIEMLQNSNGATMAEIIAATGWQAHTARGAMSGALGKKLGLTVTSAKEEGRGRVYRVG